MSQRLYVYYRVPMDELGATVQAVHAVQLRLRAAFAGLTTELLFRDEARNDGTLTLMEVYAGCDDLPLLRAALAESASALPQPRHDEVFETLP